MSRGLVSAALDLLYPRRCIVCRRFLDREPGLLCPACRESLPPPEPGKKRGEFYDKCVSVCSYEDRFRTSFLRFKFGGCAFYAEAYGPLLAEAIREAYEGAFDLVTYVPVSRRRRRRRGYDQTRLLAEAACRALGISAETTVRKVRHNPPQSGFSTLSQRRANVINAFQVTDPAAVAGKRVLLIDDVLTTGATLTEVSRILRTAGADKVVCATLAIAPNHKSR